MRPSTRRPGLATPATTRRRPPRMKRADASSGPFGPFRSPENQLAYTDLVATETGVITALPVEVGQVVSAGQLIVRVARLDELEAVVSIPESRIDGDRNCGGNSDAVGGRRPRLRRQAARGLAPGRPGDAHLSGPLFADRSRTPPSRSARRRRCISRPSAPASAPSFLWPPSSRIRASPRYGSSMKPTAA